MPSQASPHRERDTVVGVVLVHKAVVDQQAPVRLGPTPGQHILPRLISPVADQLHMLAAGIIPQHGLQTASQMRWCPDSSWTRSCILCKMAAIIR